MAEDNDEGAGEWQSRGGDGENVEQGKEDRDRDEDDDAVMIDTNSLLPPPSSTTTATGKSTNTSTAAAGTGGAADQGQLKFPALSAKEMQGKVETQTRKVSVSHGPAVVGRRCRLGRKRSRSPRLPSSTLLGGQTSTLTARILQPLPSLIPPLTVPSATLSACPWVRSP